MIGMGQHPVSQEPVPIILTYWPEVLPTAFCGSYVIGRAPLTKIDFSKLPTVSEEGSA
jgi:hypothetical protein